MTPAAQTICADMIAERLTVVLGMWLNAICSTAGIASFGRLTSAGCVFFIQPAQRSHPLLRGETIVTSHVSTIADRLRNKKFNPRLLLRSYSAAYPAAMTSMELLAF